MYTVTVWDTVSGSSYICDAPALEKAHAEVRQITEFYRESNPHRALAHEIREDCPTCGGSGCGPRKQRQPKFVPAPPCKACKGSGGVILVRTMP
jgi:hypothetical protein